MRLIIVTLVISWGLNLSAPGWANTIVVNNSTDTRAADGFCTLREAIKAANTQAGDDVIGFAAEVTGSIEILTALPAITTNLQIVGPGADKLTVKRSAAATTPNFGVFSITAGTVIISGLTLRGGSANTVSQGGGITNSGNLTLNNCVVTANTSSQGGGGIYNTGSLTLNSSTISSNSATGGGGGGLYNTASGGVTLNFSSVSANQDSGLRGPGIYNAGSLTVRNSTINENGGSNSLSDGAGIYNTKTCVITNSTISGNLTRFGWGGGVFNNTNSSLTVSGSTITNNQADVAGGLFNSGTINITNTIVAGNHATQALPDTHGSYISQGYNLIGNVSTFTTGFNGPGDQVGTEAAPIDPKLGPLAANGGPTLTHALLANSPAIDQGSCSKGTAADQRGVFRYDFAEILNADGGCDTGAFEAQPPPVISIRCRPVKADFSSTGCPVRVGGTSACATDFPSASAAG